MVRFIENDLMAIKRDFTYYAPYDLKTICDFIATNATAISERDIAPIALKSDKGLAYHRLPFDLDSTDECPTFDELFSRMTNAPAVLAFIGSIFDATSSREQFPYIYGVGENGKGRLLEYLLWQLDDAATIANVPKGEGAKRWFNAQTYNKRLVCFGECDQFSFATSEEMKAITGNSYVPVDDKREKLFRGRAICKFIFASNVKPTVERVAAHKRRVIFAEMEPIKGPPVSPRAYDLKLRAEGHAFLSKCWREYQRHGASGGVIATDNEVFTRLAEYNEEDFQEIVNEKCVISPDLFVLSSDIAELLKGAGLPGTAKRRMLRFLEQRYGVKRKPRKMAPVAGGEPQLKEGLWGIGVKGGRPPARPLTVESAEAWRETVRLCSGVELTDF